MLVFIDYLLWPIDVRFDNLKKDAFALTKLNQNPRVSFKIQYTFIIMVG